MLTVVYIIVLVVGLVVAAVGLMALARTFTPGSQAQADISTEVVRYVPLAVGTGAAVFGVTGLILDRWSALSPGAGVIWALGAGLLVGFVIQAVLYARALRHLAAEPSPDASQGMRAEVVITIPGNGIGQIAYHANGQTIALGASSATFQTIPAGATVVIERILRHVALVRPIESA